MLTLVCSLPRTGTSLVMQMLHAAGLKVPGSYPGYETEVWVSKERGIPYMHLFDGRYDAVKWLEPHLAGRIDLPPCRIILTTRCEHERWASQLKYSRLWLKEVTNRRQREAKRVEMMRARQGVRRWCMLKSRGNLEIAFETMLVDPLYCAELISDFIGQGDPEKMAACVMCRGPECAETMLEEDLRKNRLNQVR